jgi:hypothetical protein
LALLEVEKNTEQVYDTLQKLALLELVWDTLQKLALLELVLDAQL